MSFKIGECDVINKKYFNAFKIDESSSVNAPTINDMQVRFHANNDGRSLFGSHNQ